MIFVEVHQASDYNYCIWYLVCAGYLDPLQNFTARHPDWIAHDLERDCFSPSKEASFLMRLGHNWITKPMHIIQYDIIIEDMHDMHDNNKIRHIIYFKT